MIKILAIDDEIEIVNFLKEALEQNNRYYIEKCSSSSLAEMLGQNMKYSLIVTDYRMPFLNGVELIKNIRSGDGPNKDIPILFISSFEKKILEETKGISGIHFMKKPLLIEDLVDYVERIIG
jgi:two-component SAPR family response regulator